MEIAEVQKEKIKSSLTFEYALLEQLLPVYYKRLFPYTLYFKWLSYGNVDKKYFPHREFSFTVNGDVYFRYQSFSDQLEMEKEFQKNNPEKIDIGAVYNYKPRHSKTIATFSAKEKELVIDIDMTDYDEVRNCCDGANICPNCWPFMTVAMKIIDRALRDDFGYQHLLWVYSGRRGVHCWVCDEGARKLSVTARASICDYLTIIKGGTMCQKKVFLPEKVHPSIENALEIIEDHFEDLMIEKQNFLSGTEEIDVIAGLSNDPNKKQDIVDNLKGLNSSAERWKALVSMAERGDLGMKNRHYKEDVMLQMCYPRLDANVTKGLNHLLKSPFCIHPKTGHVCVPIDISQVEDFDPFEVPTISQLCEEINQLDATNVESSPDESSDSEGVKRKLNESFDSEGVKRKLNESSDSEGVRRKVKDFKKTSLSPYIHTFQKFLAKLETTWKGKLLEESDMKMEF